VPNNVETPFTVPVFDLMHRPGEFRERELDIVVPERFGNAVIGVPEGSVLHVDLRLESLHDGILVSAAVEGTAAGECVRCLIDVDSAVEVDIQELFAYSHDEAFEYEVQDDVIDLEPVVRDAVVLSLPFQPVCQEDCLGLCPQCGARLLDNPGHKHETPVDPRWAALAALAGGAETTSEASPLDSPLTGSDDTDVSADSAAEEEKR